MEMDNDILKRFGQRIAQVRKQQGYSQEKLALESGLARSYMSSVERGQRNISLLNIYKIAETLRVSPIIFFEAE